MQRDPIGYVSGLNMFEYVRSRLLIAADPFGFYDMQWGWGDFSEEQKQKIVKSFKRVRDRMKELILALDYILGTLPGSSSYDTVRDELNNLRAAFDKKV